MSAATRRSVFKKCAAFVGQLSRNDLFKKHKLAATVSCFINFIINPLALDEPTNNITGCCLSQSFDFICHASDIRYIFLNFMNTGLKSCW